MPTSPPARGGASPKGDAGGASTPTPARRRHASPRPLVVLPFRTHCHGVMSTTRKSRDSFRRRPASPDARWPQCGCRGALCLDTRTEPTRIAALWGDGWALSWRLVKRGRADKTCAASRRCVGRQDISSGCLEATRPKMHERPPFKRTSGAAATSARLPPGCPWRSSARPSGPGLPLGEPGR